LRPRFDAPPRLLCGPGGGHRLDRGLFLFDFEAVAVCVCVCVCVCVSCAEALPGGFYGLVTTRHGRRKRLWRSLKRPCANAERTGLRASQSEGGSGLVWGLAWCGVVWCGLVWFGFLAVALAATPAPRSIHSLERERVLPCVRSGIPTVVAGVFGFWLSKEPRSKALWGSWFL